MVLGLRIDEKIWTTQKCSEADRLTQKKKTSQEEALLRKADRKF